MTDPNETRFQFSTRSLLTFTTVVALIAAAIGKYPAVASAALVVLVFLLGGIARIAVAYLVGYGIVLPITLILSTPIVLVLAFFRQRPYFRTTLEIYRKIVQSFVAFFEQGGFGII